MSIEEIIGLVVVFVIAMVENIAAIPSACHGTRPSGSRDRGSGGGVEGWRGGGVAMMLIALLVGYRIGRELLGGLF